jgi:presenilin-like A22 family membrane protease
LSGTAWTCEAASGGISSLWELVTPEISAVAILVGVPVYIAVAVFGRRWIFKYGE